jgi:hypothetical protein
VIPAPYPSDTRAKGWRFELDHERIRQSDTWVLCAPDVRPWLLMLWMVAWEQTPCGSLPNDDALIAARIGMSPKAFARHRSVLMRGWEASDDGRLYHHVITLRVLEMLEYRRKEAERRSKNRGKPAEVPDVSRGTDAGQRQNSTRAPGTSTSTGTSTSLPSVETCGAAPSAAPPNSPPPFDGKNAEILNGKSVVALSDEWELPERWGFDAEALGFTPAEVLKEAERFRQYWTRGKGKGTRRSVKGWSQSWSNWLGKAGERR